MRSREEIKERLRRAEAERAKLEKEYKESSRPEEKFTCAVMLGHLETEIKTLKWVLGEVEGK